MDTKKSKYAPMFALWAVLFALSAFGGMFYAHCLGAGKLEKLSAFVGTALDGNGGFVAVMLRGIRADFRYTLAILVCTLAPISAYVPGAVLLFKGFCTGTCAAVAVISLERVAAVKISAVLFLSCVLTVPIYILMLMVCVYRAGRYAHTNAACGERVKDYFCFAASVMLMFAFLCAADCVQALLALIM